MATKDEWSNNNSNTSVKGLPRVGYYYGAKLYYADHGYYWSSTPNDDRADYLDASGNDASVGRYNRVCGFSVRPVLAR